MTQLPHGTPIGTQLQHSRISELPKPSEQAKDALQKVHGIEFTQQEINRSLKHISYKVMK